MLRIVTTTLEFLVLVLSSYSACARRSDDCYFLEPLLNDGQEAIYVGTIQWALRSVFSILFLGALVFISKKLQKINCSQTIQWAAYDSHWAAVSYNKGMTMTSASQTKGAVKNLVGINEQSAAPKVVLESRNAVSPTSGAQQYSGPSTSKEDCSAAIGASSKYTQKVPSLNAVDTDNVSAGSGSESRAKAKTKSRKSKPLQGRVAMSLSRSSSGSMLGSPDSTSLPGTNSQLDPKPILVPKLNPDDRVLSTVGMVSQTVTEGADDDDFISTDRRRRRKTKSLKFNSATNSTESLLKTPCASSPREQDVNSSPTGAVAPSTNDLMSASAETNPGSDSRNSDPVANPPQASLPQDSITQEHSQSEDTVVAQKPSHPKSANHVRDSKPVQSRPTVRSSGQGQTIQRDTEGMFVHPLHALNSSSPIVRLKPSHKRSQSAQLPSCSPWSIPLPAGNNSKCTQESSLSEMSLPASPASPIEQSTTAVPATPGKTKNDLGDRDTKNYDLFGQSSIWYSPFQSGLDISIESDQEQGKHGSRSVTRPKPRIQVDLVGTQSKPSLGSFLPASSFFESSPRTPRIMPFSQYNRSPGSSTLETEDWSVRTRSSSIAAPMTPLLEADCMDPMDYFGGSRSANSSRRGSIENNLTESLLSGRARMFAPIGSAGSMPHGTSQDSTTSSPVDNNNTLLSGGGFLSSRLNPAAVSSPLVSFASVTSPLMGQLTLDTPTSTDSSLTTESLDAAPAFVNPWESNYPYRSNHTVSETFLPFGSSSGLGGVDQGADQGADLHRQSSLLRLMNGDSKTMNGDYVNGSSGAGGNTGGMHALFKAPPPENEMDSIRKGFQLPGPTRHSGSPLQQLDVTSFRPFASVEMSLAAAANQPPPLHEDHQYDTLELTMQHELSKPFNKASAEGAENASGRVFGTLDKKPRERHRHGRSRSGHHKSASLGSFFPPIPPAPGVPDSATPGIQANTGGVPPNRSLLHRSGSDGRSSGGGQSQRHGHSSHGQAHGALSTKSAGRHQSTTAGLAKEGDGVSSSSSSSTVPRRRAGTDLDSQPHRGANKHHPHHHHHHQDSTKTKRGSKKEQPLE
ncbi:hypothetical protein BGZ68_004675 [Mortierella alpina]|nr:hypothetical protein BGZ68_004675 [Mortierella alpina]